MRSSLAGQIESNYDETVDSFDTMNLKPELLRGMFREYLLWRGDFNKCTQVSTPMDLSARLLFSSVPSCQ